VDSALSSWAIANGLLRHRDRTIADVMGLLSRGKTAEAPAMEQNHPTHPLGDDDTGKIVNNTVRSLRLGCHSLLDSFNPMPRVCLQRLRLSVAPHDMLSMHS
jgi:hypothetical protein